jgi:hypothetical protein
MTLGDFAMVPYPGSHMPRDFYSEITLHYPDKTTYTNIARLNNPMMSGRIRISQTGWDPGDAANKQNEARDENGRYIFQQRYVILGIGNNVGIHIIFIGACLIILGIPWAFYIKPALLRRAKHRIQQQLKNAELSETS